MQCYKIEPHHEKTCFILYANNNDADQTAHPRSLISAFVFSAQNFNWAGGFESYLVENPEDRFSRDVALMLKPLCSNCRIFIGVPIFTMFIWAPSSEFVSSSIPSWQMLTAHAQPFRGARDLVFCLKVPLDSLLIWASSEGSGETARMRRLTWTFAARIGDKYQIRLTRPICFEVFTALSTDNYRWVRTAETTVFQNVQPSPNSWGIRKGIYDRRD